MSGMGRRQNRSCGKLRVSLPVPAPISTATFPGGELPNESRIAGESRHINPRHREKLALRLPCAVRSETSALVGAMEDGNWGNAQDEAELVRVS